MSRVTGGETRLSAPGAGLEVVLCRLDTEAAGFSVAALPSVAERARAARFVAAGARRQYTLARWCLRRLLGERLGVAPEAVELTCGEQGKPALGGAFAASGLHFSVSRNGDLAAIALARGRRVGIDIEAVPPGAVAAELAAASLSRRELAAWRALPGARQGPAFARCWTRKEAFVKALGCGLHLPPAALEVWPLPAAMAAGWAFYDFFPGPGRAGALVVGE